LRQAHKLGLLGLAIALVAAFGLISGLHGPSKVQAQALGPKNCFPPAGGTFAVGTTFTCTFYMSGGPSGVLTFTGVTPGFQITNVVNPLCAGTFTGTQLLCSTAASTTAVTLTETVAVVGGGCAGNTAACGQFFETISCTGALVTTPGCNGSTGPVILTGVCNSTGTPVFWGGTCSGTVHDPTGEEKWCNNTTSTVGLSQVIGASTIPLAISGPGTSFTIPLFGGASTCWIQLTENGTPCGLPSQPGTITCSDGFVTVSLPFQSTAVISCSGGAVAQPFQSVSTTTGVSTSLFPGLFFSPNGGACQQQTGGTTVVIPCGATAGATGVVTGSATCDSVSFDIASFMSGCFSQTIVQSCPLGSNNYALTGGSVTVTVSFQSTGFNGGQSGGIVLGENTFSFQAPGVGTLLVTATP